MRTKILFSCLVFAFLLHACAAVSTDNLCLEKCDRDHTSGPLFTWCGSDDKTHTTTQSAITLEVQSLSSDCYSLCGVSVKHFGACGCPNDCYNDTNHGECDTKKKECKCKQGWGGADCSMVDCSDNKCSNHGRCKNQDKDDGGDYCACDAGFTGYDCSVQIPSHFRDVPYGSLPFGQFVEPGNATQYKYFVDEKNGETNPIFNSSVLATIKINLDNDDLDYLVDPANRRNDVYKKAKMFFDNGIVSEHMDIEFRIKGLSSRMLSKKSWNVKFSKSWHNIDSFSLKAEPDDHVVSYIVTREMFRSMNTQTHRTTAAVLFLNDAFYGVYVLHERFKAPFMKSRFGSPDTNLYQVGGAYFGTFLGATPEPYQKFAPPVFDKLPIPMIVQQSGNGDWADLTMMVAMLAHNDTAANYVQKYFDYRHFIRSSTVDFAVDNFDCYYGTGNNYMWANVGTFENPHWTHMPTDFDNGFKSPYGIAAYLGMTPDQLQALLNSGVTQLGSFDLLAYTLAPNPYMLINRSNRPVANAVYAVPGTTDYFTAAMTDLINRLIFKTPGRLLARRQAYYDLTKSMVHRDKMMTLPGFGGGAGPAAYEAAFNGSTLAWMKSKYSFLGSMFIAQGHGTCDINGACVCNAHYSGPTCQTYTP